MHKQKVSVFCNKDCYYIVLVHQINFPCYSIQLCLDVILFLQLYIHCTCTLASWLPSLDVLAKVLISAPGQFLLFRACVDLITCSDWAILTHLGYHAHLSSTPQPNKGSNPAKLTENFMLITMRVKVILPKM